MSPPTDSIRCRSTRCARSSARSRSEKTIVISTHILEEVDAVCTRAIIIAHGKLVADDTPAGLKARAPSGRLEDVFRAVAA